MKTLLEKFLDEQDRLDEEQRDLESVEAAQKAADMAEELDNLDKMSEAEACAAYNVDFKDEAREYIREYWQNIA